MRTSRTVSKHLYWLVPAFSGAGLYLINLPGTWIYDDLYIAHDDPRLQSVHRWREYLTTDYFAGAVDNLWRPVVSLSYAVQWWLHGGQAWPFHLLNLVLHAIVCLLVAKLGQRLSGSNGVGLMAGLLFAAHPIHVEAVTGIVGRAEEMCAIGVLGAMLLVMHRTMTIRRAIAVTACFLFGAMSKEQGTLLPFILLGWIIIQKRIVGGKPLRSPQNNAALILTALLTATLAAFVSYRNSIAPWFWDKTFIDPSINPIVRSIGIDRGLIPMAILGRYAALLAAPWRLAPDYSASVFSSTQHIGDPFLWIGLMTLIAFGIAVIVAVKKRLTTVLFCLMCLAITYFLAGNILVIGTIFGERLMYLPSVFVCILVALAFEKMSARPRFVCLAILLAAFCIRTETYAWQWNDRLRFYTYSVEVQPKSSMVYMLLADELRRRGDLVQAERVLKQGRSASPGSWRLWNQSAQIALQRGQYTNATLWAQHAMEMFPSMSNSSLLSEIAERMATPAASRPSTGMTIPSQ